MENLRWIKGFTSFFTGFFPMDSRLSFFFFHFVCVSSFLFVEFCVILLQKKKKVTKKMSMFLAALF